MFKKLFSPGPGEDQEEARIAYEKVVAASRGAAPEAARSARMRIGMLCRTHFDKTFVEGAEKTATHRAAAARALIEGKEPPAAPQASAFQRVAAGSRHIWVYLPEEYAQQAFEVGGRYQLTEIGAEQAIVGMQNLADQVFLLELRLEQPFEVLQFLREELHAGSLGNHGGPAASFHSR